MPLALDPASAPTRPRAPLPSLLLLLVLLTPAPAACDQDARRAPALPEYIHVCQRDAPDIDACINASINALRPQLLSGLPELDVPPLDPVALDEIKLSRGPAGALFEATIRNIKAFGAPNFIIEELKTDLEKNVFDFKLLLPKINFLGDYQLRMNILLINIFGKGHITGNFTNYKCDCHLKGNKVIINGEEYLKFDRMGLKLNIGKAKFYMSNLFNGDRLLGEATNRIINENVDLLLAEVLPAMEISLANVFTDIANKIMLSYPYDILFPHK
ncbi:hypothetical protein R5R35_004084 [Gryllus longicercus]